MADFQFLRKRVYTAARTAKRGYSNPRYDTSDIAQESVLQFLREVRENDLDTTDLNHAGYAHTVVKGHARRMYRDNMAARRSLARESSLESCDLPVVEDNDPATIAENNSEFLAVVRAMGKLEPEQRRIVYLKFFDKKSIAQIAKELCQPATIVRRRCERAMKELRILLS